MSSQIVTDPAVEAVERFIAGRQEPQWMTDVRRVALDRFRDMEWPTAQDEEFRRSDVSSYDFDRYRLSSSTGLPQGVEVPVVQSGIVEFSGTQVKRRALAEGLAEKGVVF